MADAPVVEKMARQAKKICSKGELQIRGARVDGKAYQHTKSDPRAGFT